MLQLITLGVAVLIAFIRGGKFTGMPKFKMTWILLVSILMQGISIRFAALAPILVSAGYVFLIAFIAANSKEVEFKVIMFGSILNALVIWLNAGHMPVDHYITGSTAEHLAFYHYNEYWHQMMTSHTIFPILGDIIYVPYPVPTLLSCGDIFIFSGIILLIQRFLGVPVRLSRLAGVKE